MSWLIAALLGPQLVGIAIGDLRGWRISNVANLALAATYVLMAPFTASLGDIIAHAAFAALMFFLMLWPFSKGWLGGGDVKFLTAAFLWVGPFCASMFSLALLGVMLTYLGLAWMKLAPARREGRLHRVPFGPIGALALGISVMFCPPF